MTDTGSKVTSSSPARLRVNQVSQKFMRSWIFRDLSFEIGTGERLLLTGPNGSGKSTLIRIIAGQLSPSKGSVSLEIKGKNIPAEEFYRHICWTGPYFDLYPELTLEEAIQLHFQFKTCILPNPKRIIEELNLKPHARKALKNYSSGMLQRVKVGLTLFTQGTLLLLDEAGSNLDPENANYIFSKIDEFQNDRMLIFASNTPSEYNRFERRFDLGAEGFV